MSFLNPIGRHPSSTSTPHYHALKTGAKYIIKEYLPTPGQPVPEGVYVIGSWTSAIPANFQNKAAHTKGAEFRVLPRAKAPSQSEQLNKRVNTLSQLSIAAKHKPLITIEPPIAKPQPIETPATSTSTALASAANTIPTQIIATPIAPSTQRSETVLARTVEGKIVDFSKSSLDQKHSIKPLSLTGLSASVKPSKPQEKPKMWNPAPSTLRPELVQEGFPNLQESHKLTPKEIAALTEVPTPHEPVKKTWKTVVIAQAQAAAVLSFTDPNPVSDFPTLATHQAALAKQTAAKIQEAEAKAAASKAKTIVEPPSVSLKKLANIEFLEDSVEKITPPDATKHSKARAAYKYVWDRYEALQREWDKKKKGFDKTETKAQVAKIQILLDHLKMMLASNQPIAEANIKLVSSIVKLYSFIAYDAKLRFNRPIVDAIAFVEEPIKILLEQQHSDVCDLLHCRAGLHAALQDYENAKKDLTFVTRQLPHNATVRLELLMLYVFDFKKAVTAPERVALAARMEAANDDDNVYKFLIAVNHANIRQDSVENQIKHCSKVLNKDDEEVYIYAFAYRAYLHHISGDNESFKDDLRMLQARESEMAKLPAAQQKQKPLLKYLQPMFHFLKSCEI